VNEPMATHALIESTDDATDKSVRTRSERGYVMTMMVIMLPVLMGFMALAVDATYYFFRGVQIQRAADAAALAGVTRMPKYTEAVSAGGEIAKRNGFIDGEDDTVVTPSKIPRNNKRFKMTITDNNVGLFFGNVFSSGWSITRSSTAEYISNIPLGSKENAIGTGYLSDSGKVQNFWLSVAGPCSPKEAGDQLLSRYDGNMINTASAANPSPVITNQRKFAALCDVDPAPDTPLSPNQTGPAYIRQQRSAKLATLSPAYNLFPGLVQNLDYGAGKTGYDYIIDVPCAGPAGTPPPCDSSSMPGDLMIQVYDPAFNPDSIQRYAQQITDTGDRTVPGLQTNDVDEVLKPDKYGLAIRPEIEGCASSTVNQVPNPCTTPLTPIPAEDPKPWDVRVTTDFRVYPPDNSPLDYSDDVAMNLVGAGITNTVTTVDKFVPIDDVAANPRAVPAETGTVNRVRRFGSCITMTDSSTTAIPDPKGPGPHQFYSVRTTPAAPSGIYPGSIADATTFYPGSVDNPVMSQAECTKYMSKWVTIKRVPMSSRRGRYRLNVRTIDAVNSFGANGFGIRAFFVFPTTVTPDPCDTANCYPDCLRTETSCATISTHPTEQRASVAGDSTMSVFASVNNVATFYLAQLSPAKLFRNKVIVVSLWDPGEGAETLEILRPESSLSNCDVDRQVSSIPGSIYCVQDFNWTIGRTGIAKFAANPADQEAAISNSSEYPDICQDKGNSPGLTTVLQVSRPDLAATPTVDGTTFGSGAGSGGAVDGVVDHPCTTPQPNEIKNSRNFGDAEVQKFNDRLVTLAIKVPENYGCKTGTGVTDPATGVAITCVDLEDPITTGPGCTVTIPCPPPGLPEGGWWRIRYTPRKQIDPVTGLPIPGKYKKITDRTTWTVGLRGDPVHLVPDGQ
jgi:hypothetical protein